MHWVTKIIYHSCYFTSLSNCLLFKQKGYLNCYVAQLFMPWHKNACLLLHGKVTHYNPSYSPPRPPFCLLLWASRSVCRLLHAGRGGQGFQRGLQRISAVAISLMSLTVVPFSWFPFEACRPLQEHFGSWRKITTMHDLWFMAGYLFRVSGCRIDLFIKFSATMSTPKKSWKPSLLI